MNDAVTITNAQRWRVGCVLLPIAFLFVLTASCALGSAGIRAGVIQPPIVQQQLGPIFLVARTTRAPVCPAQCPEYLYLNPAAAQRRYAVWVVVVWPRANGRSISIYHLAQIPLERSPYSGEQNN